MKKLIILSLTMVFTITSFAQDKPDVATEKNVIKINSLALFLGTGSIFYEREITDLASAQFGLGYLSYKFSDTKFHGLILTPEFKLYIRKNAIDGFYVSPYLRYNDFGYEADNSSGSVISFGGGIAFGRQWIFRKGFVIDLFFGGHYTSANIKLTSGTEAPDISKFDGFKTRVGLSVGFAF